MKFRNFFGGEKPRPAEAMDRNIASLSDKEKDDLRIALGEIAKSHFDLLMKAGIDSTEKLAAMRERTQATYASGQAMGGKEVSYDAPLIRVMGQFKLSETAIPELRKYIDDLLDKYMIQTEGSR